MTPDQIACMREVWKHCPRNFKESFAVYQERVVAFLFWDRGGIALTRVFGQPKILWIEAYSPKDCRTPKRVKCEILKAAIALARHDKRAEFLAAATNEQSAGIMFKMGFQQVDINLYSVKLN